MLFISREVSDRLSDDPVFKDDHPLCSKFLCEQNMGDLISVKVDILLIQMSVVQLI
jgi:hypothetical protein